MQSELEGHLGLLVKENQLAILEQLARLLVNQLLGSSSLAKGLIISEDC